MCTDPDCSICDSGPKPDHDAANRQTMGLPVIPPEYEPDQDQWQAEVNRVYNERCDNAQMAINPPAARRVPVPPEARTFIDEEED